LNLMLEIQKSIFLQEGSINKMAIDDKGLITIAVFGLPPLPHENDPQRAVRAAKALVEAIPERLGAGCKCTVGISSGQTFCGVVGSEKRREYTVMGDMVNLAARLMSMCDTIGQDVLVDESTYRHTETNFGYNTSLLPVQLKGKQGVTKIFAPGLDREEVEEEEGLGTMGRLTETEDLRSMVAKMCIFSRGGTLVLTGDHGSGRSGMVDQLEKIAAAGGMVLLRRPKKDKGEGGGGSDETMGRQSKLSLSNHPTPITHKSSQLSVEGTGSPRQPRHTISAGGARIGTMKELKEQAKDMEDQIVDKGKELQAWGPVLDEMVKQSAAAKGIELSDHAALASLVLGMLSAELRVFGFELNEMIEVLCHSIEMEPNYKEDDPKPVMLVRMGKMILELVKAFGQEFDVAVVLHLRVGETEKSKNQDMNSWKIAEELARWLKARADPDSPTSVRTIGKQGGTESGKVCTNKWACDRWRTTKNMILCITCNPLVRQMHLVEKEVANPRYVLLDMATKAGTALQLTPFSRSKRDKYLVDVLKHRDNEKKEKPSDATSLLPGLREFNLSLKETRMKYPQLVDFVSDFASGVPKYIEELVESLFKQEVIGKKTLPMEEGGMIGLEILNPELAKYTSGSMDGELIGKICKLPKKLVGKAKKRVEQLEPYKKDILKYASTMKHFSIGMLRNLLLRENERMRKESAPPAHLASGSLQVPKIGNQKSFSVPAVPEESVTDGAAGDIKGAEASKEEKLLLDGELNELVSLCVLETVGTIEALNYIRLHDPQAKVGYSFQCKLAQHVILSGLLDSQKDRWKEQMRAMREQADSQRSIGLKQYGKPLSGSGMPQSLLRLSAQFRAQASISISNDSSTYYGNSFSPKHSIGEFHAGVAGGAGGATPTTTTTPGVAGAGGRVHRIHSDADGNLHHHSTRRGSTVSMLSQRSSISEGVPFPLSPRGLSVLSDEFNASGPQTLSSDPTLAARSQLVDECLGVFNGMLDHMEQQLSRRGGEEDIASADELLDSMEVFKEHSRELLVHTVSRLESTESAKSGHGTPREGSADNPMPRMLSLIDENINAGASAGELSVGASGGEDREYRDVGESDDEGTGGGGQLDGYTREEDGDSVSSFIAKLDAVEEEMLRQTKSLPAVGLDAQHDALKAENARLRTVLKDVVVHAHDFTQHHAPIVQARMSPAPKGKSRACTIM
jgi:hypothetical protein